MTSPHEVIECPTAPSGDAGKPVDELVRALLVDDSEDDAVIAQAMLASLPGITFAVDWTYSFDAGLKKLKENAHDICLLDFRLGQYNGLDLLQEALRYGCRIPIIMLTGTTDRQIDLTAIKLGASDYLVKGETNPGILERVIRHARERKRAESEREHLTQQLIERSRLAGMGEVATHILHNVGNILNSINVSAGLLSEHLHEIPFQDVQRIARLLELQGDKLGIYLTQDSKGQRIPGFLAQLGDHFIETFETANKEIENLAAHINDVKAILAAQDELAKTKSVVEPVLLKELLECAFLINKPGFEKHHIHVVWDFADLPQVFVDKYQVLQILTTLLRNAQDAMSTDAISSRRLFLKLDSCREQEDSVRIQVQDTGVGINPHDFLRIFAQDFAPQKSVHGLGLHWSALAAKNLGGGLSVWSEGEGHGATFTLTFPMKIVESPTFHTSNNQISQDTGRNGEVLS